MTILILVAVVSGLQRGQQPQALVVHWSHLLYDACSYIAAFSRVISCLPWFIDVMKSPNAAATAER